jgi:hypothetical protein
VYQPARPTKPGFAIDRAATSGLLAISLEPA